MEKELPPLEEILGQLIAIPSVSSTDPDWDQSNARVVDRLAELASDLGFRCDVRPVPEFDGKVNLVATLGDGEDALILSGHTDTVPYDPDAWDTDPFELVEKDGRYHGLGTADMKGFFASALHAVARVGVERLRRPVVLLGTADEESGMEGMRALVESGLPPARAAIIGEPTDLIPVHRHKGVMMERIEIVGRAGHASDPSLGASALDGMAEVLADLIAYRDELSERHRDPGFTVPHPTLNLGKIEGGDSPNRICARCDLDLDVRLLPGMKAEDVRKEIRHRLKEIGEGRDLKTRIDALVPSVPSFETPSSSELIRAAEEITKERSISVLFGTEGPFLSEAGVPTVVLGPGSIRVAHQANEHVSRSDLERATDLYAALIERFAVESA